MLRKAIRRWLGVDTLRPGWTYEQILELSQEIGALKDVLIQLGATYEQIERARQAIKDLWRE